MRALIGNLPRVWGMADTVVGRIIDTRKFQFVFRNEESLNFVLKRGPWSFNEWMLVTHKWTPNMPDGTLKIIPFWIQIYGIPPQYLTLEMVQTIGRSLGHLSDVDFDENGTRLDSVRVRLDWNIDHPLRFKREFQFGHNERAILSFYYERLRNFCKICGMLTHDKSECPLRFDVKDDNDDPDGNDNDDFQYDEGTTANLDTDGNEKSQTMENQDEDGTVPVSQHNVRSQPLKIDPSMIASPSTISLPNSETSFSLLLPDNLSSDTRKYLLAKLTKGKFTDEDLYNLMAITKNYEDPITSPTRQTGENGIQANDQDPSITSFQPVPIPGLTSLTQKDDDSFEKKLPNLLQGLDYLKTLSDEEQHLMIHRFKENYQKTDDVAYFGDYVSKMENDELTFSPLVDRDFTAETWYYLKAKLAKGTFTTEEFMDLFHQYSSIVTSNGYLKSPLESASFLHGENDVLPLDETKQGITGIEVFDEDDYLNLKKKDKFCEMSVESLKRQRDNFGEHISGTLDMSEVIPGLSRISATNGKSSAKIFPNFLQDKDVKVQTTEESKEGLHVFNKSEYVDMMVGDVGSAYESEAKRRRISVIEGIRDACLNTENQSDLALTSGDNFENLEGTSEVVRCIDGGAEGPVPPPVP